MKFAIYNGKEMNLQYFPRESFQMLYEAGQAGKITCAHCSETVQLILGIRQAPYFAHTVKTDSFACEAADHTRLRKQQLAAPVSSYAEQGGFRIPKSRSITSNVVSFWKETRSARGISAFLKEDKRDMYSILNEEQFPLDSAQYEAATHTEGPLLILAGAGSGKTRVLTARTAYMIQEAAIDPKSIMLVTFTTKAAQEMKNRLLRFSSLAPHVVHSIVSGTFHSIFYKMLLHHDQERWSPRHLLKQDWMIDRMLKEAGAELGLDDKEFPYDQAAQQIGYWKNTLTPYEKVRPSSEWEEKALYLYRRYEEMKRERGLFDFDDMLIGCYELLKEHDDVLRRYQQRLRYFLIDEVQDINKVQYEIIRMLSSHTNNLCVVGDEDQAVYAFRGSDPMFILHFDRDYPDAKIITLNQNYRSSHSIVTTANKVIQWNQNRRDKQMKAQFQAQSEPLFFFPYDEEEEATMIVSDIQEQLTNGAKPADFAVLYRTNSAARAIFERLTAAELPFVIDRDAQSFYERRIVRSLLAYLRLSLDEEDEAAMRDVLTALFLKQSVMQDVKAMSILHDCTLARALGKLQGLQPFQQKKLQRIAPMFRKLRDASPLAAIDIIEKDMGFADFVKKSGSEGNAIERGSDDIRDLKVVARKFTSIFALLAHADYITQKNDEMRKQKKEQQQAIQLLTIHRAKGLEYEQVYLLEAVDGSMPHDFALEELRAGNSEPLEEERRIMYVAMTRAKQSLYVSVPSMRRGRIAYPSRFIKSLL